MTTLSPTTIVSAPVVDGDRGSGSSYLFWLIILHGSLMVLGVGVLLPIGVVIVRFGDRIEGQRGWLYVHKHLQFFGMIVMMGGFAVALFMTQKFGLGHFDSVHSIVGIVLLFVLLVQICLGFFRPKEYAPGRKTWRSWHVVTGWSLLAVAVFEVALGLQQANAEIYWICAYATLPTAFIIVFIVSEYHDHTRGYAALPMNSS